METTLLHKVLPLDGSILDVYLDDTNLLDATPDVDLDDTSLLDAIPDVDLDDTNLLDAIPLFALLLPIHLLIDDMDAAIVVHFVASLDVDVAPSSSSLSTKSRCDVTLSALMS